MTLFSSALTGAAAMPCTIKRSAGINAKCKSGKKNEVLIYVSKRLAST